MDSVDRYLIIGIGVLFSLIGVVLFFKNTGAGANKIKLLKFELELSSPSLVIFVIGAIMIVFPFFMPNATTPQEQKIDVSSSYKGKPGHQDITIDSAMNFLHENGKIYFTNGDNYWRIEPAKMRVDNGYPLKISNKTWPNLKFNTIDAVVNLTDETSYIFKDNKFQKYSINDDRAISPAQRLTENTFPGLTFSSLDAAIKWGNDSIFFFKGNEYSRFSISKWRVDTGFPKYINSINWPGLKFNQIDAATPISEYEAVFFSGNEYVRYSIPKRIAMSDPKKISALLKL